ncbi:hypothetical protein NQ317_016608 [Molorchus minor]|uniref:RNA-directed DNA polymerase n=1 Tax=Molorchus minor TaxID=1323400 RepID=A0ABQ9JGW5_9CUCU|nr:hypothetical protein NQ317_016608 [Molorchus minor]
MVIDTGSYHTIVKPNILAHCKMKPTTNNFILETAGGETLPVIGVHEAEFQLGRTVFRHQVFVANITDDVLMGLELMKKHGFQLNLQERSIKTGQDEIIISMPRSDEKVRRITLTEDVILPALSETIVMVNLEPGEDDGQVELIEPDLDEDIVKKGLLVAKTLTQRKNNTVPVRLVNLKNCDQKLKNGDVLGKSQAVTCITKCEDIGEGPSYCDNEEIPEKGQIARWLQRLQEYDFKIEHRKGRLHGNADAISRRPCAERCSHCKRAENKEFGSHCRRTAVVNDDNWETKKLCEEQQKDEDIKPFIAWKEEGTRPEWKDISNKSTTLKGYWAIWDSLIVEDGILKRLWENTDGKEIRKQIVLPRARVNEVLQEVHGGVGGGHFGVNKTLNKVRERFYWLRSRADVEDWCRRCAECASSKGPRTRSRGQMKQYNLKDSFSYNKSQHSQDALSCNTYVDKQKPIPTTRSFFPRGMHGNEKETPFREQMFAGLQTNLEPQREKVYAIKRVTRLKQTDSTRRTIQIFSESQATLNAVYSYRFNSETVWNYQKTLNDLSLRNHVTLVWIPGYSVQEGNEIAHSLAKKGVTFNFIGLETALGILYSTAKMAILNWSE